MRIQLIKGGLANQAFQYVFCFQSLEEGRDYRVAASLTATDQAMNNNFWVGVPAWSGPCRRR